ncbi:hypothetical protein [Ammonifex thiophilus]|uniref:Uncharacterized protein n=1 Tax=Ammonifex thiophilus TaxID=444093 RepID=A0A3D8P3W0_9THEO|nr:hypothetical protein [Ammonifex thiophilus]RDV82055.1 hypothetical protein DXX99_08355 [Ammonifex thiophilus]
MITVMKSEVLRLWKRPNWIIALFFLLLFAFQGYHSYRTIIRGAESAYYAYVTTLSGAFAYLIIVFPLISCLIATDSLAWDRRTGLLAVNRFAILSLVIVWDAEVP